MTWTSPAVTRPDGSLTAPETDMLAGVLDWHRSTLLWKCAGLTGDQLASRPLATTNLSLLGMIRHLSKVERIWFRRRLRAEPISNLYSTAERPDADFEDVDPERAEADYGQLVVEQELARQAVAGLALETRFAGKSGEEISVRYLLIHMIGEYARHNGHVDLIREALDGTTGA